MKVVAVVTVVGLVWACLSPEVLAAIPSFTRGLLGPPAGPMPRPWEPGDATKLLTGITFAGLGGFWILLYSYWLREKGSGMARYGGHITGLRESAHCRVPSAQNSDPLGTGHWAPGTLPDDASSSRAAWYNWRRYLTIDALVGIVGNLFTTLMTCLLAWALLFPKGLLPQEYELAVVQSRFFEVSWGPVGRVVFLIVAAAFLTDTWLATADGVSRMQADIVTTLFPAARHRGEQGWYWICLGLLTAVTCFTMLLTAPGPLILLSAVIGFVGTVAFPAVLWFLNYRQLPAELPGWARPGWGGAALLGLSFAAYAVLAGMYLREVLR
jgi:hypothetical protein